jgi:CheY-like chemotaxis protein
MSDGRWVLLIASEVGGTDSVSDRAMERLCEAIQEEGYRVIRTSTPEDGLALVKSDPSFSAILLDWDLTENTQFDERAALKIIRAVRRRNTKVSIFLIADRTLVSELPLEVMKQVHEYIHLFGDTPAFIANRVDFAVVRYHDQLLPPYFRELKKYTDQGAYSWDAPGHMGGVPARSVESDHPDTRYRSEGAGSPNREFLQRSSPPSSIHGVSRSHARETTPSWLCSRSEPARGSGAAFWKRCLSSSGSTTAKHR